MITCVRLAALLSDITINMKRSRGQISLTLCSLVAGPERALRRGVVLQVVARRLQAGVGLQRQHRHDLGLRPRRQATVI